MFGGWREIFCDVYGHTFFRAFLSYHIILLMCEFDRINIYIYFYIKQADKEVNDCGVVARKICFCESDRKNEADCRFDLTSSECRDFLCDYKLQFVFQFLL